MSQKLTNKRLEEIKNFPITFDEDIPEFSDEEIAEFKPKKTAISIKLDTDILEALKAEGKGYQTRINDILRKEVFKTHENIISLSDDEKEFVSEVFNSVQKLFLSASSKKNSEMLAKISRILTA